MILRPFDTSQDLPVKEDTKVVEAVDVTYDDGAIESVLGAAGLSKRRKLEGTDLSKIRTLLEHNGAGLEDIAISIGNLIQSSGTENSRLRANEIALRLHGLFKDMEDEGTEIPSVTINISGSNNKTIVNLVMPGA